LAGVLARYNKLHGRAVDSTIDVDTYCPPEILQVGGPLFGDIEGIAEKYDDFLSNKISLTKLEISKCCICGYPNCTCIACDHRVSLPSKQHGKHTCFLQFTSSIIKGGGAPPKHGYYADNKHLTDCLLDAWVKKGIKEAPAYYKFKAGMGTNGYYWPEEVEH